jgi:hypothetical protein
VQPEPQAPLFDGYEPAEPLPVDQASYQRRLTQRQAALVAAGRHPLTRGPIHPLASRHRDASGPKTDPFTCGSCALRQVLPYHNRAYPKCMWLPPSTAAEDVEADHFVPPRVSHSTTSDVRSWWPACRDYQPGDPTVSHDAARWVPGDDDTP